MKNTGSVKANKIKYDKCQIKHSMICSIVFLVLAVSSTVILHSNLLDSFSDMITVLFTVIYMCSGPAFFYSGYQVFFGVCYMKRLAKHGYEIPENKKDYEGLLDNLPHQENSVQKESFNKSSLIMGILSVCCLIIATLLNVRYVLEWNFMDVGTIVFLVGIQIVFDCLLLIHCIMFFRQINVNQYKDDIECDDTRKNRIPLPDGILFIVVLFIVFLFTNQTAHSMTDYYFKVKLSNDVATAQYIRDALTIAQIETDYDESDWNLTEQSLLQGLDITTWGVPSDPFQKEVAKLLEISDFTQLRDDFYLTDGDAVVYVQFEDNEYYVHILNLSKKVDVEISAP